MSEAAHRHAPDCPLCGHRMRPLFGTHQSGTEWTEWMCPRCLHQERTPWSPAGGRWSYDRLKREAGD